jgi:hypothetical protein
MVAPFPTEVNTIDTNLWESGWENTLTRLSTADTNLWESGWKNTLTRLSTEVCQWLATARWFSPGPPVSSTNKTDCHDIAEILLTVALNTIKQTVRKKSIIYFSSSNIVCAKSATNSIIWIASGFVCVR